MNIILLIRDAAAIISPYCLLIHQGIKLAKITIKKRKIVCPLNFPFEFNFDLKTKSFPIPFGNDLISGKFSSSEL